MTTTSDHLSGETVAGHAPDADNGWHPQDEPTQPSAQPSPVPRKASTRRKVLIAGIVAAVALGLTAVAVNAGASTEVDQAAAASDVAGTEPAVAAYSNWEDWSSAALPVWSQVLQQYSNLLAAVDAEDEAAFVTALNGLAGEIDEIPGSPSAELDGTFDELSATYRDAAEAMTEGDYDSVPTLLEEANALMSQANELVTTYAS